MLGWLTVLDCGAFGFLLFFFLIASQRVNTNLQKDVEKLEKMMDHMEKMWLKYFHIFEDPGKRNDGRTEHFPMGAGHVRSMVGFRCPMTGEGPESVLGRPALNALFESGQSAEEIRRRALAGADTVRVEQAPFDLSLPSHLLLLNTVGVLADAHAAVHGADSLPRTPFVPNSNCGPTIGLRLLPEQVASDPTIPREALGAAWIERSTEIKPKGAPAAAKRSKKTAEAPVTVTQPPPALPTPLPVNVDLLDHVPNASDDDGDERYSPLPVDCSVVDSPYTFSRKKISTPVKAAFEPRKLFSGEEDAESLLFGQFRVPSIMAAPVVFQHAVPIVAAEKDTAISWARPDKTKDVVGGGDIGMLGLELSRLPRDIHAIWIPDKTCHKVIACTRLVQFTRLWTFPTVPVAAVPRVTTAGKTPMTLTAMKTMMVCGAAFKTTAPPGYVDTDEDDIEDKSGVHHADADDDDDECDEEIDPVDQDCVVDDDEQCNLRAPPPTEVSPVKKRDRDTVSGYIDVVIGRGQVVRHKADVPAQKMPAGFIPLEEEEGERQHDAPAIEVAKVMAGLASKGIMPERPVVRFTLSRSGDGSVKLPLPPAPARRPVDVDFVVDVDALPVVSANRQDVEVDPRHVYGAGPVFRKGKVVIPKTVKGEGNKNIAIFIQDNFHPDTEMGVDWRTFPGVVNRQVREVAAKMGIRVI